MKWQVNLKLAPFEFDKKWNALVSKNKKAILLLPETFMNNSGKAIAPSISFFKIRPKNIIALHDDSDIEFGRTKLSFAKHSAGHKGVESTKRAIGTLDFWRLRIGIQPPLRASLTKGGKKKRVDAMKLVLQKFKPDEEKTLKKVIKKILEGLEIIIADGPEQAMNFLNQN
ncbi:MAG: Peptidyl-tRNA hydrolase [Parcubacteria group bacterium GW2011_GWA2_42_14]|nr:MAG: Peptidyl-tRNA hydrolase [Parcubacteria group bacterium GW2011_GWA2_42_14]